jgi:hypothetical protein
VVDPVPGGSYDAGLPSGTIEHCISLARSIGALAGASAVSGIGVAIQVRLPEVMAAAYGSSNQMRPGRPAPAPGLGWLHADLSREDSDLFDRLMATLPPDASASVVARAAQEWRLAVCDYRRASSARSDLFEVVPAAGDTDERPFRILDLTNMWAGPLATWLLKDLGASVIKVEPAFRPDGFRAFDGRGIHPNGDRRDPGRDSAMWNALNHGKEVVDIDLRSPSGVGRFLDLARESALVMDTFSPRVMPNFGLADQPAGATRVTMPAFRRDGPERDWVAYGTGVHAVTGRGDVGDGSFAAPAVSYPDAVGGFTAALAAVAAVAARRRGPGWAAVSTSLQAAVEAIRPARPAPDDGGSGARLLSVGRELGLFEDRLVGGHLLPHPSGIFHVKQNLF